MGTQADRSEINQAWVDGLILIDTPPKNIDPKDHEHYWVPGPMYLEGTSLRVDIVCQTCGGKMVSRISSSKLEDHPPTISPEPDGHYHCWHSTGTTYLTYPPLRQRYCCHCGVQHSFREGEFSPSTKTHGKYIRQ